MTEHQWENGVLVRSVTVREAEWDDEERGNVLAFLEFEASTCSGCGGWLPETTDPDAEGSYVATTPVRCYRCDAVQNRQKEYDDPKTTSNPSALRIWPVTKKGGSHG